MIRKLRRRFILTTLAAVLFALVIMIGSINFLNYKGVIADADAILEMLIMEQVPGGDNAPPEMPDGENAPPEMVDGEMPEGKNVSSETADGETVPPEKPDGEDVPTEDGGFGDGRAPEGDAFGKKKKDNFFFYSGISEETPFESRYFSVTVDADGSITESALDNIASVDEDGAVEYAEKAVSANKDKGTIGTFRYLKKTNADGSQKIFFLDMNRSIASFRTFLLSSLIVSLIILILAAAFVILASSRILKPVAESYAKQKSFITDAGHELKTPVAVIEADASVLEMEIGENEWVEDIQKQTARLATLTNELTYLAKMDEARTPMNMIEFPVSDVVQETAQSYKARAIVEQKEFTAEITPMLTMVGDMQSIQKLTSILLDNAVKYSSDQGEISVSLNQRGKNICLTVTNTADQINEEMLSHMFERFYRADKARSRETGGFGIGLSIAQAIVSAHKGKISAESPDGKHVVITAVL